MNTSYRSTPTYVRFHCGRTETHRETRAPERPHPMSVERVARLSQHFSFGVYQVLSVSGPRLSRLSFPLCNLGIFHTLRE